MWEFYDDKTILITGGSGFVGTAIVHRLLSQTSAKHVYVLCRGGSGKLRQKWDKWLPLSTVENLWDPCRLTVLDGDILTPNMGLDERDSNILRGEANVIIHAASSINLAKSLNDLKNVIVGASEMVAGFALGCKSLDCFVYVSTAYANSHLHAQSPMFETDVNEEVYELDVYKDVYEEWVDVQKLGTSRTFEIYDFPFPYAYAKHLTERLLLSMFNVSGAKDKLLIARPSIVGPAQLLPYPGYSVPTSTPSTMLAASLALLPQWNFCVATSSWDPDSEIHTDEVPVDVVVDRLLSHLAMGTRGCFHAVSGKRARLRLKEWWQPAAQLRRIPWGLNLQWVSAHWRSPIQNPIARIYVILGTSFVFHEDRTVSLSQGMSKEDQAGLQLFTDINLGDHLLSRQEDIRYVMDQIASKNTWAWLMYKLFY
ncbi:hypothetical protein N7448_006520 [Penicillium atrosanguineum]|uniref:Fatty acyl-CoA reductase n=1 Tax=Penicillium atrosanguineum TaxID=1132637 RepID=A0A9W9L342_9EURO|nr:hypothetical protein N7448_006520 [Penicillium atrosanguineum]KAJ5307851.1 hypothetical protein N7476_008507 [Penicillium atrosanguineum]